MVMNLQFFGGRGGFSGIGGGTVAFDVNMDGSVSKFVVRKGKVYRESGDAVQMSAQQIMENAKSLGYDVKTYNARQEAARQKMYAEDRKKTSEFLNIADAQMGGNRGDQRRATRGRRGSRRGI